MTRSAVQQRGTAGERTVRPAHVDADALVPILQQDAQQSAAMAKPRLWAAGLLETRLATCQATRLT
jgi:hypothetical protein